MQLNVSPLSAFRDTLRFTQVPVWVSYRVSSILDLTSSKGITRKQEGQGATESPRTVFYVRNLCPMLDRLKH